MHTKIEMEILFDCTHPFMLGMKYLFTSNERLHFVMPYILGNNLYQILLKKKRLDERVIKFYAA